MLKKTSKNQSLKNVYGATDTFRKAPSIWMPTYMQTWLEEKMKTWSIAKFLRKKLVELYEKDMKAERARLRKAKAKKGKNESSNNKRGN